MIPRRSILLCSLAYQVASFSPSLITKVTPQCSPSNDSPLSNGWGRSLAVDGRPAVFERGRTVLTALRASPFAVPASSLEQDLSKDERTTVRVVRAAGPSVAYVTSLLLAPSPSASTQNRTRLESRKKDRPDNGGGSSRNSNSNNALPYRGQPLGSGSGFVVDAAGYLCTNFHVVEAAYTIQQAETRQRKQMEAFWGNVSSLAGIPQSRRGGNCLGAEGPFGGGSNAQVYVRIDSQTRYRPCRIVDVVPELDVAVLKVESDSSSEDKTDSDVDSFKSLAFGASGSLLVGQQLIAIGNPFGLDNTVTTGVVSALNREIQVGGGGGSIPRSVLMMPRRTAIRNCIQTDCAINPGNSGGPLLNRQGKVVGMNTAIVTTSGSSAGIGFAVPSDLIQPAVQRIIRADRQKLRPAAFLGVRIVKFQQALGGEGGASGAAASPLADKNWILGVEPGSPAAAAGMKSLRVDDATGRVEYGDAIVAVSGNSVPTFAELQAEVDRRKAGEQVQVTLEDKLGNRRVVYLTLADARGFQFGLSGDQPCLNLFFASWTLNTVGKYVGAMIGVFLLAVAVEGVAKFRIHFIRSAGVKSWNARSVRTCVTLLHGFHAFLGYVVMLAVMTYSAELLIVAIVGLATGYAVFFSLQDDLDGVHISSTPCCNFIMEEGKEGTHPTASTVANSDAPYQSDDCCNAVDENGNAAAR